MDAQAPLVVGFDLDMTLIDTRPGFAATLAALSEETGVALDVEAMSARLGPPLSHLLEPYFPPERIDELVASFREHYPRLAIAPTRDLPGAHDALAAVRRHGGRLLLVTGKFTRNAALHVEALEFDVDHLEGEVWGVGKAEVLRAMGASVYVGDHVHDVEGALAAGCVSVSVLTGGCSERELLDAGTHVVLEDLTGFPVWLDEHLGTATGWGAGA